jgi:hypothetical protein
MDVKRYTETAYNPVFLKILEDIPGGVTLITKEIPSDVTELGAGTPLCESATTLGLYNPVKSAKSTSTQTASTSITVRRPHLFKVGEFIAKDSGYTATTISSITHTAATTDTIVTSVAVGALTTNTRLIRAAATSRSTSGFRTAKYLASVLLRDNIQVRNDDLSTKNNVSAGAVVNGSVKESILPFYISNQDKTSLTSRIRFAS